MRPALLGLALSTLMVTAAAGGCRENFTSVGLPLLSQIEYRTYASFSGLDRAVAAKRIAARLKDEGYNGVKRNGTVVTAWQETSGSGRPQALRFIVSGSKGVTTIEAIFTVQQGQVAGKRVVRDSLCKVIAIAAG